MRINSSLTFKKFSLDFLVETYLTSDWSFLLYKWEKGYFKLGSTMISPSPKLITFYLPKTNFAYFSAITSNYETLFNSFSLIY